MTALSASHECAEQREMLLSEAQCEVRTAYLGGFVGQLVSAMIWFASAALATLVDAKTGFWALALGGVAIFPLTRALLHMAGGRGVLAAQNPLRSLAMQIAFTVPFVVPLAGAAALYRPGWFYPGCLVIVGAHYLPFVFLYGADCNGWMGRGCDSVRLRLCLALCLQEGPSCQAGHLW